MMRERLAWLGILGMTGMMFSCLTLSSAEAPSDLSAKQSAALQDFATQLVLKQYAILKDEAAALHQSVEKLVQDVKLEHVLQAREAWRAARAPWERSEAFLFGPVDTEGHDPNLDSWPINLNDLKQILSPENAESLTLEAFEDLDEGLKGFHVLESLLFANLEGQRLTAEDQVALLKAQPRVRQYLRVAAEAFSLQANALHEEYAPQGKNFVSELAHAGVSSKLYPTRTAALQEIVNASAGIAEEAASAKLGEPSESGDVALLESRFSANTLNDVKHNVEGLRLVYESVFSSWLKETHPDLVKEYQTYLSEFEGAVKTIPETFAVDPSQGKPEVSKAVKAGLELAGFLNEKLFPVLK